MRGIARPMTSNDLALAAALESLPVPRNGTGNPQLYSGLLEWPGEYEVNDAFFSVAWDPEQELWVAFVETIVVTDFDDAPVG